MTTLYDLNATAATAANTALDKDPLAVQSIKLEAFNAAGHDRQDFKTWDEFFTQHLANYATLKIRPSPATQAAQAAAAGDIAADEEGATDRRQ